MSFQSWLQQLNFGNVIELLIVTLASILCITIHETCHGLAAFWLGDPTAKRAGRLSLNPLRHLDLVGLVCMAIAHFGWAKPVPINPRNFRNFRLGTAVTAMAGPLSNVLLAWLAACLYTAGLWLYYYLLFPGWLHYFVLFFQYTAVLSAGLAAFNMIPVPPLDGSKILLAFLPERAYRTVLRYERWGFLFLAVLLFSNLLDQPLAFLRDGLLQGIMAVSTWPFDLLNSLIH